MILAKKPPTWFQGISGSKIRGAVRVLVGIGLIVRGRIKCVLLKEARLHNLIDPASYPQGPLLLLPRLCNERVSEVALDIGFKSITNFNRTFKQLAGQSPSDYDWRFREHLNQTGIAVHVSYFYSRRGKPPTRSKVTGITRQVCLLTVLTRGQIGPARRSSSRRAVNDRVFVKGHGARAHIGGLRSFARSWRTSRCCMVSFSIPGLTTLRRKKSRWRGLTTSGGANVAQLFDGPFGAPVSFRSRSFHPLAE